MNKTAVLNELMNTQHRKALLQLEIEQLEEKEKFLSQEHKLASGMTTDNDSDDEVKTTKKTAKPASKKAQTVDLDDEEKTESLTDDEGDQDDDDIPVTKGKKKAQALDLDDEEETPKKTAKGKKAAKPTEELEEVSDEDDLDDFLGTSPDKTETAPKIGPDEVRKLLSQIVRDKGEKGKAAARKVMAKFTKNASAQVKDMLAGSHHKAYAQLQKI